MTALKPPKLELFCHEYVKGNNASDAYKPKKAKDKTIWEESSKKLALPKVRTRIEESQGLMTKELVIKAEKLGIVTVTVLLIILLVLLVYALSGD